MVNGNSTWVDKMGHTGPNLDTVLENIIFLLEGHTQDMVFDPTLEDQGEGRFQILKISWACLSSPSE